MTERERLIETICEGLAQNCGGTCTLPNKMYCQNCHILADYLLANGVIVPPCKVGDRVWELCRCDDGMYRIFPMTVTKISPYGSVRWIKDKEPTVWNIYATSDYTYMYKDFYDFGKNVFLTKEEAEKMLERKKKNE